MSEIDKLKKQNAQLKKENAIFKACAGKNADPELVVPNLMDQDQLGDIESEVQYLVDNKPKYRREHHTKVGDSGDSFEGHPKTPRDRLNDQIRRAKR